MANRIPRVPVCEQDPSVRAHNFEEVCYGYDKEEALLEASRCLQCDLRVPIQKVENFNAYSKR